LQGRRSCIVSFKTAPCRFFFEEKKKKIGSYPKMGYDNMHVMLTLQYFCLLRYSFFCVLLKKKFLFWPFSIWLVRTELPILFRFIFHGVITTSCPRSQVSQVNHDFGLDQVNVL
jgi:hypothetical protein